MTDTFSANSLKILEKSKTEFEKKYIKKTALINSGDDTAAGSKFHRLIFYFLKNYNIEKFESVLLPDEKSIWEKLKKSDIMNFILNSEEKYAELPFYIREMLNGRPFYLTGRFDIAVKNGDNCTIIDWKINRLPENPELDMQTLVYFEAASKLFKTEKVKMTYFSLLNQTEKTIHYNKSALQKIKETAALILQPD